MRTNQPLKYFGVTQEQFDRYVRVARSAGINVTSGDANEMYDWISVKTTYDAVKQELIIASAEPFWMAPGVVSGHFHELVTKALYRPEEVPAEPKPAEVGAKA